MKFGDLRVRVATPDDAAVVTGIIAPSYERLWAGWYPAGPLAAALPVTTKADPKLLASGTYFMVMDGDAGIACGGWSAEAPGTGVVEPGVGHIRHIATHPDHLGKGAGRVLLEHIFADAANAGIERLNCLSSLQAEAFYARLGFSRVKLVPTDYGPAVLDSVQMVRALP